MPEEVSLLGTHSNANGSEVQQCILPLVVLFSIAAQENRAGAAGRAVMPRTGVPYQGIPNRVVAAAPPVKMPYGARNGYSRTLGMAGAGRAPLMYWGPPQGRTIRRGVY